MNKIFANTVALLEKKERRHLCYYILLDLIVIITDIASLALLLFIIHFYTRPLQPAIDSSFLPASFIDRSSVLLILVFLVFFSVKNILAYYLHQQRYHFLYKIASRIAEKNLLQYLEGNYSTYVSVDSAVQIRRISQEPIEFSHYVLAGFVNIITQTILIVMAVSAILVYNASLFLLLFIILLPPVFLVAFIVKRRTRAARTHAKKSSENTLQFLKEALSGFVEANIYDKHNFFVQRYAGWQQQLNEHLSNIQSVQAMPNRMIEIFAVAGLFVLIAFNNWSGDPNNGSALINIGAFMAAAYKIMPAAVQLLNSNGQVKTYAYTVNDLLQIKLAASTSKMTEAITPIACLSFRNICFQYGSKKILHDFNAAIVKGDFIGIAGNSGIGKTTIINLLLGFLEPETGEIKINNITTDSQLRQHYWKRIAYVKQEPFLVHDAILTNITLNGVEYNRERMEEIIQITGLGQLTNSVEQGLNMLITENGKNISGGQRQRIVIARALYKNADLILLDEPFNELDRDAENELLAHFAQLAQSGKIVILITHNKESLNFCNKIISLNDN